MWKHAKIGSIMTSEDIYRRLGIKMNNYPDWYYIKTENGWEKREPIIKNITLFQWLYKDIINFNYDLSFYGESNYPKLFTRRDDY